VADEGDEVGEDFGGRGFRGGFFEGRVGAPDGIGGEVVGRLGEGVLEFLNSVEGEAGAGALVVDDLEGEEAVAVFLEELLEVFDGLARGDGFGRVDKFVLTEDIDEDRRVATEIEDELAEFCGREWGEDFFGGFSEVGLFRLAESGDLGGPVGEGLAEFGLKGGEVFGAGLSGKAGEAATEGEEVIGLISLTRDDAFDEVF